MTSDDDRVLFSEMILTHEQREAIGLVAAESSRLEGALERLIWKMLELDERRGNLVTFRIQFKQKLELVRELFTLQDEKVGAQFQPLFESITKAIANRRQIIHGEWGLPEGHPQAAYLKAMVYQDGSLEAQAQFVKKHTSPFPASRVMEVAREFSHLHAELMAFLRDHKDAWAKQ